MCNKGAYSRCPKLYLIWYNNAKYQSILLMWICTCVIYPLSIFYHTVKWNYYRDTSRQWLIIRTHQKDATTIDRILSTWQIFVRIRWRWTHITFFLGIDTLYLFQAHLYYGGTAIRKWIFTETGTAYNMKWLFITSLRHQYNKYVWFQASI